MPLVYTGKSMRRNGFGEPSGSKSVSLYVEYDFSKEELQDSVGMNLPKILALERP